MAQNNVVQLRPPIPHLMSLLVERGDGKLLYCRPVNSSEWTPVAMYIHEGSNAGEYISILLDILSIESNDWTLEAEPILSMPGISPRVKVYLFRINTWKQVSRGGDNDMDVKWVDKSDLTELERSNSLTRYILNHVLCKIPPIYSLSSLGFNKAMDRDGVVHMSGIENRLVSKVISDIEEGRLSDRLIDNILSIMQSVEGIRILVNPDSDVKFELLKLLKDLGLEVYLPKVELSHRLEDVYTECVRR